MTALEQFALSAMPTAQKAIDACNESGGVMAMACQLLPVRDSGTLVRRAPASHPMRAC